MSTSNGWISVDVSPVLLMTTSVAGRAVFN
jgi:hypothetical protein